MRLPPSPGDFVESSEINVTPFIDVVLVLLIIFMIAAPLSTVNVPLDLPSSQAPPSAPQNDPITVSVGPDLSVHVGEKTIVLSELAQALAEAGARHDHRIMLRADKRLAYGDLMGVVDALRRAEYTKIALVGTEAAP